MRVHRYVLPLVLIVALLGSVLVAKATGYWSTSGKATVLLDGSGQADPEDIKGKNTLAEVAAMYGIPAEQIAAEAGLPADVDINAQLKDIAATYGIEILNIREAVGRILAGR